MQTRPRRRALTSLLVTVALLAHAAPAQTTATDAVSVATEAFAPGLDTLADAAADSDRPRLFALTRARLLAATQRWSQGAPITPDDVAGLEVELAFAATMSNAGWYDGQWRHVLRGIEIPEEAASLRARVKRLQGDVRAVRPLGAWEFVGPFDNERGRGMTRRTPVEKKPADAAYAGKVREVTWREAPAPGHDGLIYLGRLVHPADQSCAVARTWIRSDVARDAVLLLSFGDEGRVWWNGASIYSALGIHSFSSDSHALRVTLEPGWNELVLKVGGQETWPYFCARLVDAESGATLALESVAHAPDGLAPGKLARPASGDASASAVPAPGTYAHLAGFVDGAADGAADGAEGASRLLGLAILRRLDQALPRKERAGFTEASAALDLQPERLAAALVHLTAMRVSGALDSEEDVNPWLAALNAALEQHGDRTWLLDAYAGHARDAQGLTRRALAFDDRALHARPDSVRARINRMNDLDTLGQVELAEEIARSLADDPAFLAWAPECFTLSRRFVGADPRRQRLRDAAVALGLERALSEQRRLAEMAARERGPQLVLRRVRERLERVPYDNRMRTWGGRKLLFMGALEPALALFDDALAFCPEDPKLHGWRARVLLASGDRAGAIDALERATTFDLSATDERRLLDHLRTTDATSASDSAVVAFHVRYQDPLEAILARHADDPPLEDDGAPREILLNRLVVDVGADGRARRYRRTVERVLTAAGARELDRRHFRAYPGAEEVRVLSAVIRRVDGTVDLAPTGRTGRRGRVTIDLPPLEPGDVVDIEWRRDDLRASIFGDYFGLDAAFTPDARLAVREADITILTGPDVNLAYYVAGTDAGQLAIETHEQTLADGTSERTWSVRDLTPRRSEAYEPPAVERMLRLQASTYASWEEFGHWWWSLIREEITTSPEMREKVAELIAGHDEPLERLRAIYDFVVTDVRYNAWEFGIHGYQPYSAPVIFSRRFGDCKDKAILLRAMLGEAGIEAWPVLIQSSGRRHEEDHALALVAHFNHCIAHVPAQEGIPAMFLDGTARLHPLEALPTSDSGAQVLIVREGDVESARVPFPTASANLADERTIIDLTAGSGPSVELIRSMHGRWDPSERHRFSGDDAARTEAVERLLTQRFGGLRGAATGVHPDYEDLTQPIEVTLRCTPESIGRRTDDGLEVPTTFAAFDLVKTLASETERTTDVLLDVPWSSQRELVYKLPKGARIGQLPPSVSLESEDIAYSRIVETSGGGANTVIIRERFELRTHRIPVERYAAFRAAARQIDDAQRRTIEVEVAR